MPGGSIVMGTALAGCWAGTTAAGGLSRGELALPAGGGWLVVVAAEPAGCWAAIGAGGLAGGCDTGTVATGEGDPAGEATAPVGCCKVELGAGGGGRLAAAGLGRAAGSEGSVPEAACRMLEGSINGMTLNHHMHDMLLHMAVAQIMYTAWQKI